MPHESCVLPGGSIQNVTRGGSQAATTRAAHGFQIDERPYITSYNRGGVERFAEIVRHMREEAGSAVPAAPYIIHRTFEETHECL